MQTFITANLIFEKNRRRIIFCKKFALKADFFVIIFDSIFTGKFGLNIMFLDSKNRLTIFLESFRK
jgi:hypothetical protein